MDRIETVKTYDFRTAGFGDRHDRGGAARVIEGHIWRCRECERLFLNQRHARFHQCEGMNEKEHKVTQ